MKGLIKIIIGVWIWVFLFWGGVFADISNYQKIQNKISENVEIMKKLNHYSDEDSNTLYDLTVKNNKLSKEAKSLVDDNWKIHDTKEETDAANKKIKDKKIKTLQKNQEDWKEISKEDKDFLNANWARYECRSKNWLSTSIAYNKNDQSPFCFSEKWKNWYSCVSWECKNWNWTTLRVYDEGVAGKTWLGLIQYFLSTILWFSLKFWAMLAVLAIILWWIQVSTSMENESWSIWKWKIIWWIAALLVLFFAWVILNFINPNYFVW